MLVLIDNYDSFTYNLVQKFGEVKPGLKIEVFRNDKVTLDQIDALHPTHICVSPGPCSPKEAGISNEVIRHFAPAMVQRKHGTIVNFSSGWGRTTDAEVAPYCATKWAVEGLTQSFAQELPSAMAAVTLNPGIINTDMLRSCFGGTASSYPSPEKWAATAVPFILGIGASDNGRPLNVPGYGD